MAKRKHNSNSPGYYVQHNAEMADYPVDQHSLEHSTKLLDMNDDCVLKIFEYLPLNDVCSFSQTCRRMHALGSSHFMQNYKSKVMVFIDWLQRSNLLETFPDRHEKYICCFAKSMRSVTLLKHFSTMEAMQKLANFYQGEREGGKTDSPIQAIRFLDWNVDINRTLCAPIEDILKNVESLTIENTSINNDMNGCLFPLVPNLRRLTILNVSNNKIPFNISSVNAIWQQPPCPSLGYFAWHKELAYGITPQPHKEEFPAIEIARFLKINPGIKFVSLRLDSKEQLKQLMALGVQVNELFFNVTDGNFDERKIEILGILNDLKFFCEKQESMKITNDAQRIRLHLQINEFDFEKDPDQLGLLAPYIVGMYVDDYIPQSFAVVLPKLIHLKVVQVREVVRAELLCLLPNLEEVFIDCLGEPLSYYDNDIDILGSRLPKLKKLYLNDYYMNEMMSGEQETFATFENINIKRKKLAGAQKLKVFLEVDQHLIGKKVDYDTVQLLRSQTEAITNPFFNQTHFAQTGF